MLCDAGTMELHELSAVELADAIRQGDVSAVEAVDHVVHRIAELDDRLRAFVTVDVNGARKAARKADGRSAAEGAGPLHGVPFSVKDLLDTAGVRTTYGSRALANNVPDVDVVAVNRLRAAGAIMVGKTATPEFAASLCTKSELNGVTRNPWDPKRSPGGSSGGAGVAVSTGMGPLAVSTDGGGSARVPAAACGVLGLKPTLGRVPHESWPYHFGNNSSVSLNTRTVEDAALMLTVMSGPHPQDPWSRRAGPPIEDWRSAKPKQPARLLFIPDPAGLRTDGSVLAEIEATLVQLQETGYELDVAATDPTNFDPGIVAKIMAPNLVARARELSTAQQALLEEPFRQLVTGDGYRPDAVSLQQNNLVRSRLYDRVEDVLGRYDLIVSPTILAEPPLADRDDVVVIDGEEVPLLRWWGHLALPNMTGHPAISVPSGFAPAGLPLGIHAIGPWDGEAALLRFADAIAEARPWRHLRPPLPGS